MSELKIDLNVLPGSRPEEKKIRPKRGRINSKAFFRIPKAFFKANTGALLIAFSILLSGVIIYAGLVKISDSIPWHISVDVNGDIKADVSDHISNY